MYPELLKIPFTEMTIKSYGTMMVVGFMVAVVVMRRLSLRDGLDPLLITNASLYSLIAGVVGARIFFVVHYYDRFRDHPWDVLKIWQGGLEFLGGVVLALFFIGFYLRRNKMPVRRCLDVMAVGLMIALAFGRIGCLLNGCCFGKPTTLPWAIRFPYGSYAYTSQINTNAERGRTESHLRIPRHEYCVLDEGRWYPRALDSLTTQQQFDVTEGKYRCLSVHPSQVYSSLTSLLLSGVLYLFWNRAQRRRGTDHPARLVSPGQTFGLMLALYGVVRFLLELSRDDNPYEFGHLTISQIIGVGLVIAGTSILVAVERLKRS